MMIVKKIGYNGNKRKIMQCFIATINGVTVLQVGTSTLSGKNKKEDRADVKKGKNKAIDLGRAKQTLTTTIKIIENSTFQQIYKAVTKDRFVTVVDKFLGELKVYVESFKIVHSDKEFGVTTVDFAFSIIEEFKGTPDYSGQMTKITETALMTAETSSDYKTNLAETPLQNISVVQDFKDKLKEFENEISKHSSAPSEILKIMRDINKGKNKITAFMGNPKAFVSSVSPLFREIDSIVDNFENFTISPNSPIFKSTPLNFPIYSPNSKTTYDAVGGEVEYMHDINLNSQLFNKVALAVEVQELRDSIYYYPVSNEATTTKGLIKGIDGSIGTIEEVENVPKVNNSAKIIYEESDEDTDSKEELLLERARSRGYKTYTKSTSNITNNTQITPKSRVIELQSKIFDRLQIIKDIQSVGNVSGSDLRESRYMDTDYYKTIVQNFIANTPVTETILINVPEPKPFIKIVYEIYGSVEYLVDVARLNKVKDYDSFSGDLKLLV